jgi:putative FmdB family regulatory protein
VPTYEYLCKKGHHFERILPFSRYDEPQKCDCGAKSTKQMSVPKLAWAARECVYDCPITGAPITSRAQHRENLKRHGCQEYDPEMKKDAANFRNRKQQELESSLDRSVEEAIEKMPSRKKELLERELTSGVDVEITRN